MKINITTKPLPLEEWQFINNFNDCVDADKREWAEEWLASNGFSARWFNIGADECGIFENDDNVFVVVSGSDKDREEWRGNFDAYERKSKRDPSYINGYHYNYFIVAEELFVYISRVLGTLTKPTIFVGTSRGALVDITAQLVCLSSRYKEPMYMSVTYDGPRLARRRAIRWFKKYAITKHIHHRAQTFASIVARIPPAWLGWKHQQTTLLRLPNVWGFNHINIREAIARAIEKRDRRK